MIQSEYTHLWEEAGANRLQQIPEKQGSAAVYVGIDGCPGGWFAVALTGEDGGWLTSLYATVEELWAAYGHAWLLLIDMPIGLADGPLDRRCDALARERLKPGRASSIFPAPVREVLEAADYAEANRVQREVSGRGLSRQSWGLVGKIRELDELLRRDPQAREAFREAHPELVFAGLSGRPMEHGKKTEDGYAERMSLLQSVYPSSGRIVEETLARYPRRTVRRDDIVDALVLAAAARLCGGTPDELPETGDTDRAGLRRTISFVDRVRRSKPGWAEIPTPL